MTFELAPVNVIIGPQGSGKSVTTKLFYFLSDILINSLQSAERGETLEDFKRLLAKQFCMWFPSLAWGKGRFNINYTSGPLFVRILRRKSKGQFSDDVSIIFSEWFTDFYSRSLDLFVKSQEEGGQKVSEDFDRSFRARNAILRRLESEIGAAFISQQTFIPAGRSFFTSIGRIVAGFEQAGSLDPITIKFARLFASIRDRNMHRYIFKSKLNESYVERRDVIMKELFGGEIKFEDDSEFVETADGRKIPFSTLSSGQQELLPMWLLMNYVTEIDAFDNPRTKKSQELFYIEEPEAHLFPSAQSLLMEFLISSLVSERGRRRLIITTHSPYIMSKLNVFLKAGQLARRKKRNQDINEIIPRECWLNEHQLKALSIEGRKLHNLIDDDGLIDGRYLDKISEQMSVEFSKLLKIESEI